MEHYAWHVTFYEAAPPARPVAVLVAVTSLDEPSSETSIVIARDSDFLTGQLCDQLNQALDDAWQKTKSTPSPRDIPLWIATVAELVAPDLVPSGVSSERGVVYDAFGVAKTLAHIEGLDIPPEAWLPENQEDASAP